MLTVIMKFCLVFLRHISGIWLIIFFKPNQAKSLYTRRGISSRTRHNWICSLAYKKMQSYFFKKNIIFFLPLFDAISKTIWTQSVSIRDNFVYFTFPGIRFAIQFVFTLFWNNIMFTICSNMFLNLNWMLKKPKIYISLKAALSQEKIRS